MAGERGERNLRTWNDELRRGGLRWGARVIAALAVGTAGGLGGERDGGWGGLSGGVGWGVVYAQPEAAAPFYPDDSIAAREGLVRVEELKAAGNLDEAARVLQTLLDQEGARVLETPEDAALLKSVRERVQETLLKDAALLGRYRAAQEARAQRELESGKWDEVERARLLTDAGYEAALRAAQLHVEAARFEAARLTLEQLERHPARTRGAGGAEAAALARRVAALVGREDVAAWARRWTEESGVAAGGEGEVQLTASQKRGMGSAYTGDGPGTPGPDVLAMPRTPLVAAAAGAQPEAQIAEQLQVRIGRGDRDAGEAARLMFGLSWVMPTVDGDRILVNNGVELSAWDRFTLGELWRVKPGGAERAMSENDVEPGLVRTEQLEDVTTMTVAPGGVGVAVGVTGLPMSSGREGDGRIHAVDVRTGRVLWSVEPGEVAAGLEGAVVRGEVMIEADTVVVALRRVSSTRRVTGAYLAGLDLWTGAVRWTRLVGTAGGTVYPSVPRPAESGVVVQGVVYRADGLGAIAAVEAHSGRVVWVRKVTPQSDERALAGRATGLLAQPWSGARPIAVEARGSEPASVVFLEPAGDAAVRIESATGRVMAQRSAADLGGPRYLLRAGEKLVAVGETRVAAVGLDEFAQGAVAVSEDLREPPLSGRAVVIGAGETARVVVPRERAITVLDRAMGSAGAGAGTVEFGDPAGVMEGERTAGPAWGRVGNLVNAGEHLLTMDVGKLHSFVSWEKAAGVLRARMQSAPDDPGPALALAELAFHAGRAEEIGPAADLVLALRERVANAAGTRGEVMSAARERLFGTLLGMLRAARGGLDPAAGAEEAIWIDAVTPRNLSVAQAGEILARLGRAAEGASERAEYLLAAGWLAEARGDARGAVESYQQVLGDTELRAAPVEREAVAPRRAERAAHARLARLLTVEGWSAYAAFDEQAARELAALGDASDAELRLVAERFPAARAALAAWARMAERSERAGEWRSAQRAWGGAVEALTLGPRDPAVRSEVARVAAALVRVGSKVDGAGGVGGAGTAWARRGLEHLAIAGLGAGTEAQAAELDAALAARERAAEVGVGVGVEGEAGERAGATVLAGWQVAAPLLAQGPGRALDAVAMIDLGGRRLGLWAVSPVDGTLERRWERKLERGVPTVLRVDWNATYVYWSNGGTVERINNDGATAWTSLSFEEALAQGGRPTDVAGDASFQTPLDGPVRTSDVMIAMDQRTVVVLERGGRIVAFDLSSGKFLWRAALAVRRVNDAALAGETLVIGGAVERPAERRDRRGAQYTAAVIAIDVRRGGTAVMLEGLGGNDATQVRWIRPVVDPKDPAGALAAVSLRDRLVLVDAAAALAAGGGGGGPGGGGEGEKEGVQQNEKEAGGPDGAMRALDANATARAVKWSITGEALDAAAECWVIDGRLFVLGSNRALWRVDAVGPEAGKMPAAPLEVRNRMEVNSPIVAGRVEGVAGAVVFGSARGVVVFDERGVTTGADLTAAYIRGEGMVMPLVGANAVVLVGENPTESGAGRVVAVRTLSLPTGRLEQELAVPVARPVTGTALVDGWVLVSVGNVTVAVGLE